MKNITNSVQLVGHLGADPEVKQVKGDNKVAQLSLATNERYRNGKGEQAEQTYWHRLVAWNGTAELMEKHLAKGKKVAVKGKLTSHSYETKEGEKRFVTEVRVDEFMMLN